jgi:hypothetical protein
VSTRAEVVSDFVDFVGHAHDPGARDTVERMYDRVLLAVWMRQAWRAFVMPTPYTFTTTPGRHLYGLPPYFGRIASIDGLLRNLTCGTEITPAPIEQIQAAIPGAGTDRAGRGAPACYALAGTMPVRQQPSPSGEALEVLSSTAQDNTVRVYLAGIDGDGEWTNRQVVLNGQGAVAIGTWKEIHEFGKAYKDTEAPTTEMTSSEGTVTLRTTVGGTVLQTLQPHEGARDVSVLSFDPVPDAAYVISVPFIRVPIRQFRDASPLPIVWRNALWEALELEWRVNSGQLSREDAGRASRPELEALVCFENAGEAQARRHRQPYSGRG